MQIKALGGLTYAEYLLKQAVDDIGALNCASFRNCEMRNEMIRKLHNVLHNVEQHAYRTALADLSDVIKRTDGCALHGAPDQNDWIITCSAQGPVYQALQKAKAAIQQLE